MSKEKGIFREVPDRELGGAFFSPAKKDVTCDTNLWVVLHESNYGTSIETVASKEMPTQDRLIEALGLDFREDDTLDVYEVLLDEIKDLDKKGVIGVAGEGNKINISEFGFKSIRPKTAEYVEIKPLSAYEIVIVADIEESYKEANCYGPQDYFTSIGHNETNVMFWSKKEGVESFLHIPRYRLNDELDYMDILGYVAQGASDDEE